MNQLEGFLILTSLPLSLLLTGYWLATLLVRSDPLERLAFALPCGLALLLAAVAAVNFFQPLRGVWAYACLAPILLTLLLPRSLAGLVRDVVGIVRAAPRLVLGAVAVFYILLLWPVLLNPATIFYDGTSNHDSFFWIAGAEHLKRFSYMELPVISQTQPLTNSVSAVVGWSPLWGRMGGEGLLALASSVINVSPLKLYLYATASLSVVWFAMVYLTLRTFVTDTPARITAATIVCLQPVYVFFYGNANLPNLLGALTGSALVVAFERALRAGPAQRNEFIAWAALATLSLHGLLCSYPEMVPFTLVPCGLLWLRPWFTRGPAAYGRTGLIMAVMLIVGGAMNSVTTMRALHGFIESYTSARADTTWANLFAVLDHAEYVPALVTLSIYASKELGWFLGWPLSAFFAGLMVLVVRRSRDPFGLCAGLAGSALLLGYTLVTDFAYGWQKTVQFSGVFVATCFPAAAAEVLWRQRHAAAGAARRIATGALVVVLVFSGFTLVMNCRDIYKWSDRKVISADWFELRELSRGALAGAPVLAESASFRMPFFYTMWSTYFLSSSDVYFAQRSGEGGGYLRIWTQNETAVPGGKPAALLVSRIWAECFDANSPRLLDGREYAVLSKANRVTRLEGVYPTNGYPDHASRHFLIELTPHSPSRLRLTLVPYKQILWPQATWRIVHRTAIGVETVSELAGPPPWQIDVALTPGVAQTVECEVVGPADTSQEWPFGVSSVTISSSP